MKPSKDEPGTLGEQIAAIILSIQLGDKRGTSAQDEWQAAREETISHLKGSSHGGRLDQV